MELNVDRLGKDSLGLWNRPGIWESSQSESPFLEPDKLGLLSQNLKVSRLWDVQL